MFVLLSRLRAQDFEAKNVMTTATKLSNEVFAVQSVTPACMYTPPGLGVFAAWLPVWLQLQVVVSELVLSYYASVV